MIRIYKNVNLFSFLALLWPVQYQQIKMKFHNEDLY